MCCRCRLIMPLIVMCGFPCSGKTRRAVELKEYFEQNTERKVHVVGDGTLGIEKNAVYADSQNEKNVRGALKADVERRVNKDDIVILDSLNYIKGYRYELFCLIKHTQTPLCLVYCLTSAEESSAWNTDREANEQYTQEILDALMLRFEAPDSRNRWDSPLFTIQKEDTLPFEAISDAIFKRKAPPRNQSTQSQPLSSTNFLYELDKVTQEVLMAILNSQKTSVAGDLIAVPGATEKKSISLTPTEGKAILYQMARLLNMGRGYESKSIIYFDSICGTPTEPLSKIELTRSLNMAELRRLRRQFISYTKLHPTENIGHIANMFVQYLNKSNH